jgi:membrane protein DedA with SNARE-associated domain
LEWLDSVGLFTPAGLYLYLFVFLVICGVGLPFPEEAIFLAAGFLGRKADADPMLLCVCGLAGIIVGDLIPYALGRYYGPAVLNLKIVKRIVSDKLRIKGEEFFKTKGARSIFFARFVAGLRTPTFLISGALGTPWYAFVGWDLLGGLLSCPTSILLAYYYGESARQWVEEAQPFLIAALLIVFVYWVLKLCQRRPAEATGMKSGVTQVPQK